MKVGSSRPSSRRWPSACPARARRAKARTTSFRDFDRRADGVAAWLLSLGVADQDRFAQLLLIALAYLESVFAAYKVALVSVDTNHRCGVEELAYEQCRADDGRLARRAGFAQLEGTIG